MLRHLGTEVLGNGVAVLWYLLLMTATPAMGLHTSAIVATVLAAGLSLLVEPSGLRAAEHGIEPAHAPSPRGTEVAAQAAQVEVPRLQTRTG